MIAKSKFRPIAILACILLIVLAFFCIGNTEVNAETYSGSCGSSVTWTFDSDTETLTVSGSGAMYDYSGRNPGMGQLPYTTAPYNVHMYDAKKIVIGNGITRIGNNAFRGFANVTEIVIGSGVNHIGQFAFGDCNALQNITIPANVLTMGDRPFISCTGLLSINVASGNRTYTSIDGNLYYKQSPILLKYATAKTETSFTVPDGILEVSQQAFDGCLSLTEVIFSDSVQEIHAEAFYKCTNLKKVILGDGVNDVDDTSFYGCSITTVHIGKSLKKLEPSAFGNKVEVYTVSEGSEYLTAIDGNVYSKDGKTLVRYAGGKTEETFTVPDGVTTLSYEAFYYCTALKDIILPESVSNIEKYAFLNCNKLETVTVANSEGWYYAKYSYSTDGTFIGSFADPAVAAVYLTDTYCGYYLKVCSHEYEDVTVPPTCTSEGYDERRCKICGKNTKDNYVDALPHALVENVVAPTCSSRGYTIYKCKDCGYESGRQNYTDMIPHTYTVETTTANCTTNGYNIYTCTVCGDSYKEIVENAWGHKYDSEDICQVCGYDGCWAKGNINKIAWKLYRDGTLTLSGSGAIPNYKKVDVGVSASEIVPWSSYKSRIKSVVIGDGITAVGNYAFDGCYNMTGVVFGSGVTRIGKNAFSGCTALTDPVIGENVTEIAGSAFYNCDSIVSIIIPDNVTTVDASAFQYCDKLASVTLGSGVKTVGSTAFANCPSLTAVTFNGAVSSVGYNAFAESTNIRTVNVSSIADWCATAFETATSSPAVFSKKLYLNGVAITEPVIPEGVTYVGAYCFYNCVEITSVTFPSTLNGIGAAAFFNCTALENVYVPSLSIWFGISFASNSANPMYCAEALYADGARVTELTVPNGITAIYSYAFCGFEEQTVIVIPDSVTSIARGAFYGCSSLESLTVPFIGDSAKTVTDTNQYPLGYFFGADSYTGGVSTYQRYYGSSLTSHTSSYFYIPQSLKKVTVTGGIVTYGAFYNCSNLTEVVIDSVITYMGASSFYGCSSLESLTVPFIGDTLKNKGDVADKYPLGYIFGTESYDGGVATAQSYYDKNGKSVSVTYYIPETLKSVFFAGGDIVNYGAFYNCKNLVTVGLGADVQTIAQGAFYGCGGLVNLHVGSIEQWCNMGFGGDALNSHPLNYADNIYINGELLTELVLPESVTAIKAYVFFNYKKLTSVVIPGSVTSIGAYAFYNNDGLVSITIPDSVTTIGTHVFYSCSNLKTVSLSSKLTKITERAFYFCSSLEEITIGSSVTYIGEYAFSNCTALKKVVLSSGLKTISTGAFQNCDFETLTIPQTVTFIGSDTLAGCTSLESLTLPFVGSSIKKATDTYQYPLGIIFGTSGYNGTYLVKQEYYASSVKNTTTVNYYIPNSLKKVTVTGGAILRGAFYNCAGITEIVLGDGVTGIETYAFYGCNGLKTVKIGDGVKSIGAYAFYACAGLLTVDTGDGVTTIGDKAFYSCPSLISVTLGKSVTSIGTEAFRGCDSIIEVANYSSLNIVAGEAKNGYVAYKAVAVHKGDGGMDITDEYMWYVADGTAYLVKYMLSEANVVLPESYKGEPYAISDYAFKNCSQLVSVVIPNTVTRIGKGIFSGCSSLESITLPFIGRSAKASDSDYQYPLGYIFGMESYDGGVEINQAFYNKNGTSTTSTKYYIPESLRNVTVNGGMVVYGAFSGCYMLSSVTIGNGVDRIKTNAFYDCVGLTSVNILDGVTAIEAKAFYRCSALTSIVIPDSVTSIGPGAFTSCSGLESITVPFVGGGLKNATDTYQYPFGYIFGTTSYSGSVSTSQSYYGSSTSSITSTTYYLPASLKHVTVTDGNVLYGAFHNCTNLTTVVLEGEINNIGKYAFNGCTMLENVNIPDSVTAISDYAFNKCASLKNIVISANVVSISNKAFNGCSGLESITVSADNGVYQSIDGNLYTKDGRTLLRYAPGKTLESFTVPESVTAIGADAFASGLNLKSVTVGENVTSIGLGAFSGCSSLESITLPFIGASRKTASETYQYPLGYIFGTASYTGGTSTTQYFYSSNLNSTGYTAYYIPTSLRSVTVLGGDILYGAFYGCKGLTNVTVGDGVARIEKNSFVGCSGLESISIGKDLTYIGYNAFIDCKKLTAVYITDLTAWCGIEFYDAYSNPLYYAGNLYVNGTLLTELTVTGELTAISKYAFVGANITKLTVDSDGITLGSGAFAYCTALKSIYLDGVTSMGDKAFMGCTSMTKAVLGNGVTSIGAGAFNGCSSLESMVIPFVGTTKITSGASEYPFGHIFGTDSYEGGVDTQQYVKSSSNYTTYRIPASLKSVTVTGGNLPYSAFKSCINLTEINCQGVTSISDYAFYGCTSLTRFVVPDSVTSIPAAFNGCTALTQVVIGDNVTEIGMRAFYGCSALTDITIGKSVKTISGYAFENCTSLARIHIADPMDWFAIKIDGATANPTYYGGVLCVDGKSLPRGYIPEGIEVIPSSTFVGEYLTEVVIPDSVKTIERMAFYNCKNLTSVTIGKSVTTIADYAFDQCPALTQLILPDGVTSIGEYAFYGCSALKSIVVPDSVNSIGFAAFYGCISLEELTLPFIGGERKNSTDPYQYPFGYIFGTGSKAGCTLVPQNYRGSNSNSTTSTTYSIPTSIKKVTVTGGNISYGAFYGCTMLKSVILCDGVSGIDDYAFNGCSLLISVTIGKDVAKIGNRAFYNCSKLIEVVNNSALNIEAGSSNYGYAGYYAKDVHSGVSEMVAVGDFIFYTVKDKSYLVAYVGSDSEITLPIDYNGGQYAIYPNAFYGCSTVTRATMPTPFGWKAGSTVMDWKKLSDPEIVAGYLTSGYRNYEWSKVDATASGALTELARWELYSDGTLVIYGSGETPKYSAGKAPWNDNKDGITEVVILGVSSIGNCSFYGLDKLASVEILSEELTAIGEYAFFGCTAMKTFTVPSSVTSIGKYAFRKCSALSNLIIENIAGWAADGAYIRPEYIVYPDLAAQLMVSEHYAKTWTRNVNATTEVVIVNQGSCGTDAFWALSNSGELRIYGSGDMKDYFNAGAPWYSYRDSIVKITVGEGIVSLGTYAFERCAFTEISLPSSLKTIDKNAINNCGEFKKLNIPKGVTSIAEGAVSYCYGIETITVDSANAVYTASRNCLIHVKNKTIVLGCNSSVIAKDTNITAIGGYAFVNYTKSSITIPSTITKIGAYAFYGCHALTELNLPNALTEIGAYAFAGCSLIKTLTVPESVNSIGEGAFAGFVSLKSITLPFIGGGRKTASSTYQYPFGYIFGTVSYGDTTAVKQTYYGSSTTSTATTTYYVPIALKTVVINGGNVSYGAFQNCTVLTDITLSDGVSGIGDYAFYACSALKNVTLGKGINAIGSYAFYNCTKLTSVTIPENATVIGGYTFYNCSALTEIVIPDGVTSIGSYAFYGCTGLTNAVIGSGVTNIGTYAFYKCNKLESINIPAGVTAIGASAFSDCKKLTAVTIPMSVTSIGSKAFYNCTALTSVTFENPFRWIAGGASVEWVYLIDPTTATKYLKSTYCTSNWTRSTANISGEVSKTIRWEFLSEGTLAIYGSGAMPKYSAGKAPWNELAASIKHIAVAGVSSIGNCSFYGLDKVTYVVIDDTVTSIGDYAFFGCTALTELTVPESVTTVGAYAFRKCSALSSLKLSAIAGWSAGETYVAPKYLVFPDLAAEYFVSTDFAKIWTRNPRATTDVSLIKSGSCDNGIVWSISSENELRVAGRGAIADYEQGKAPWASYADTVTSISIGSNVTRVGNYAFYGFEGAKTVTLGLGVRTIGKYAFGGCGASVITLPANLNAIEEYAFAGCAITKLAIPASVNKIAPAAFYGCTELASITVDSANTYYKGGYNCIVDIKAKSIILGCKKSTIAKDPTSFNAIGKYAFAGSGVSSLKIPSSIVAIGDYAFADCASLTSLTLPNSVTTVGNYAFAGSAITKFSFPNGVTAIGDGTFKGCTALSSVTIPGTVASIGMEAFRGCTALSAVTVPASVRYIYREAFVDSAILSIKLVSAADWNYNGVNVPYTTIQNIDETVRLFKSEYAGGLWTRTPAQSFPVSDTFGWELTRNGELFIYGIGCMPEYDAGKAPWSAYKDKYSTVIIGEGITSVGKSAFYGLNNITEVRMAESIMVIGEYAFFGCNKIASITIPAKVYTIGAYAMRKTAFTELKLANPNGWSVNGMAMGDDVALFNAYLSGGKVDGVSTTEYKYAFRRADSSAGNIIDGGTIAKSDITWSFSDTGVLTISGTGDIPDYTATGSPWYQYHSIVRRVVIGEGITSIGSCAFYTCSTLESVNIAGTVTTIGGYSFYKCTSLMSLSIPESVTTIEAYAFRQCDITSLELAIKYGWSAGDQKFTASELATAAADYLSKGYYKYVWVRDVNAEYEDADPNYADGGMCNADVKWKLVWIDEERTQMKLTVYGIGAMPEYGTGSAPWYQYAEYIVEVEVEAGVTTVGRCAFYNLTKLAKVTLCEGLTAIGEYAFNSCKALTSIEIPSSVTVIGKDAFKKTGLSVIPTV